MTRCLVLFFCLLTLLVQAQPAEFSRGQADAKYWILFSAKDYTTRPALSPEALAQRQHLKLPVDETDQPVSVAYLNQLKQAGIRPVCQSRWLNAVSARLTTQQYAQVLSMPFVKSIQPIDPAIVITSIDLPVNPHMAPVMTQIQAPDFAQAGLTGRFVTIGVIDAGFLG